MYVVIVITLSCDHVPKDGFCLGGDMILEITILRRRELWLKRRPHDYKYMKGIINHTLWLAFKMPIGGCRP